MPTITQGALYLATQITGSEAEAMDILQTAVTKSLENRHAPNPQEQGYRAWFYRVVHNQAIDWLRSERKFDHSVELDEIVDEYGNPEVLLEQECERLHLHKALASLSAEQREIICLKDFHDFSYDEIAQIMSIEKGTVMSRLHRARVALKKKLLDQPIMAGGRYGQL